MSFDIKQVGQEVHRRFVGVHLNTDKVKPVHIANGLFRTLLGRTASTELLYRFVLYRGRNGKSRPGHSNESIVTELGALGALDQEVVPRRVEALRMALHGLLAADDGVFFGGFDSYSAGHESFVSRDRVGQEAGEFVGRWLRQIHSPLCRSVENALKDDNDVITQLCRPLTNKEFRTWESEHELSEIECAASLVGKKAQPIWKGMEKAAATLSRHLDSHPDKLLRLRRAALFAGVVVFRHIMCLESYYSESNAPCPIVLDCGNRSKSTLTDASRQSFARALQSIVRFYGWAFADVLRKEYRPVDLMKLQWPVLGKYDNGAKLSWKLAKTKAKKSRNYLPCGEVVFDALATQTNADPTRYFRALGRRIGLLHPPNAPRYLARQDLMELFLMCAIDPGETIGVTELLARLWDRFGIIVGGIARDEQVLLEHRIQIWDRDNLRRNAAMFSDDISRLGFATQLADSVLRVTIGGGKS